MPFTPLHMGPGIVIKAIFQSSFSLMVFGWTQVVMDIQPLIVIITGEGHLHGFTHTYIGAILIALLSAVSGKYFSEFFLKLLRINDLADIEIKWRVAFISAFIGSVSHVFLDSIMHQDVEPFYPFSLLNNIQGIITLELLHKFCFYSGVLGGVFYFGINWFYAKKDK